MSAPQHLWEVDHPYYCNEGNYFKIGNHEEFSSWADFHEEWGAMDEDMNLVFRWDWNRPDPSYFAYELEKDPAFQIPGDTLQLYYMMQRKARNMSVYVAVTEDDEPKVRKFLEAKAAHMRKLWEPLLEAAS